MLSKDKVCIVHLTYLYFPNRFLLWTRFFFALKTWRWRHILLHLRRGLFNCRNRLSDWRTQGEPNKINRLADLQLQCYNVKSVFKHAFNEILYYWNINYKTSKLFSYWEQTLPFLFELFQGVNMSNVWCTCSNGHRTSALGCLMLFNKNRKRKYKK